MLKFFHRRALANNLDAVESCIKQNPYRDYVGVISELVNEVNHLFPDGLRQAPCPATRAYCVDMVKLATKAASHDVVEVWVAASVMNVYFATDNMYYHDPSDHKSLNLKKRARQIIDRFYNADSVSNDDVFYQLFEDWYDVYKTAIERVRPEIVPLLAFMDMTPLGRAFKDRVDPNALGEEFGKNFDASTFGK